MAVNSKILENSSATMEDPQRYEESTFQESSGIRKIADMVPARVVLYILSFTGFLSSFMMRTDINIAIVEMAKIKPPSFDSGKELDTLSCHLTNTNMSHQRESTGEFEWSQMVQSTIIGSFYWCYILSQVVGGVLTQYFGTKTVFGGSQLITAICSLLIPTAANTHYGCMIALRSIQGIASGLTWPAMYATVGHWIPPVERSRFMSSFQGFSFGIGLTYMICGFIISNYGWQFVFYTTGSLGVIWCVAWYFLAFDTPASHPRISQQELRYIQGSVGNQVVGGSEGMPVPWKAIVTSWPVWAIAITTFGRIWVHYIFIISGPKYLKTVLGFDIEDNGVLSGAPFICSYLSSVVFCYLADVLVRRQIMSLTNVRKCFTALSQVIPGILVLSIGYLGCSIVTVMIVWFIAVTLITAAYAGAMASIVDIAPNLAGPVLAFAQTIHMTASFLSPLAVGSLTSKSLSLEAWRHVFALAAGIACSTYIVFQIFGTAEIQAWNYPGQKYPQTVQEDSQPLSDDSPHKNIIITSRKTSISRQA